MLVHRHPSSPATGAYSFSKSEMRFSVCAGESDLCPSASTVSHKSNSLSTPRLLRLTLHGEIKVFSFVFRFIQCLKNYLVESIPILTPAIKTEQQVKTCYTFINNTHFVVSAKLISCTVIIVSICI